jgi:predicted DsbA family dithiol-disulfide isomerase
MEPPSLAAPAPTGRTLAIAGEHALDRTLVQQTKTAIRRLAAEQGIDLARERVSLWRPRSPQEFEHLASTRSIYQGFQLAETFAEELFLFDAPAGDVLTLVAAAAGEGK